MKALVIIASLIIGGCDKAVEDYVSGAKKDPKPPSLPSVDPNANSNMLKLSPGQVRSTAVDMGMNATITPTKKKLTAADMGAVISINQTRVEYE